MGESRFRKALQRLTASDAEREDEELQSQVAREGATPVPRCQLGQQVCVSGEVRSVSVDARGGSPVLDVEVYDGTGTLSVLFLGRTDVAGLQAGRHVTVHGRVTQSDGRRTMFNPRYELLPADAGSR